jgi:hypothetical protein
MYFRYQLRRLSLLYVERIKNDKINEIRKEQEANKMRLLRSIKKWFHKLIGSGIGFSAGIDSYKWESKIEIISHFAGGH